LTSEEPEMNNEEKICDIILEANQYARYAAVCDCEGKILWDSNRDNVEHLLTEEETNESLKRAIDSWHARDKLAAKVGKGKFAVAGYDKLIRITIPLKNDHLLLVTVDGKKPRYMGSVLSIVDFVEDFI
jgi:hypothetical protein